MDNLADLLVRAYRAECHNIAMLVVLLALHHVGEPVSGKQLRQYLGQTPAAFSQMIKRMCRRKLVLCVASRDRRSFNLTLTETGRNLMARILAGETNL
jgi:DNA-binding MarR family transcriptional regulator